MSRNIPSPKIRELAKRLFAYEDANANIAEASMPALALVFEKLRSPLVTLIGIAGFRSLLARALTLARGLAPGLSTVHVEPDGSLAGLSHPGNQAQVTEAGAMMVAELLGLLFILIGESLTLALVRDAWPDLPFLLTTSWRKDDDPAKQSDDQ